MYQTHSSWDEQAQCYTQMEVRSCTQSCNSLNSILTPTVRESLLVMGHLPAMFQIILKTKANIESLLFFRGEKKIIFLISLSWDFPFSYERIEVFGDLSSIFFSQKGHPEIRKIKGYIHRHDAWLCEIFWNPWKYWWRKNSVRFRDTRGKKAS